jgi:hypothetical protein
VAQETLREWPRIFAFFGDRSDVRRVLDVIPAHFLGALRWNSFPIVLAAFALTLACRAQIRAIEQWFQTTDFVVPMQNEFLRGMEARQH